MAIDDKIPATETEFPDARLDIKAAMNAFRTGVERDLSICFPACVYEYDRTTHKAKVMPLIKAGYFNGKYEYIRRQPIEVTVRSIQCGGVTIELPLYIGDTGWVISSDRDTVLMKQEGALSVSVLDRDRDIQVLEDEYQVEPNTPTLHQFSQGFFIPDSWGTFDSDRYKDSQTFLPTDGIYIGTSFDTADKYQDGMGYETQESASLIVSPHQGIVMANSQAEETEKRAAVALSNASVEMSAEDTKEEVDARAVVGLTSENGVVIRHISTEGTAVMSVSNGGISATIDSDGWYVGISIKAGSIQINAPSFVNINTSNANIVASENANVVAAESVSVNAGKNVNIAASQSVNVAAADEVSVAAGSKLQVQSGETIEIQGAKDLIVQGGQNIVLNSPKGNVSIDSSNQLDIKGTTINMTGSDITITGSSTLNLAAPNYVNEY